MQPSSYRFLLERPRLSSLLVVFLSGVICLAASYASKWLPGADGRFTTTPRDGRAGLLASSDSEEVMKDPGSQLAARPRRYSVPILVACIVIRLEIFNYVNYKQQCSASGVEVRLVLFDESLASQIGSRFQS